jgi:hypothetical protein
MSQKNDEIKRALDLATTDRSGEVSAAAGQVQGILRSIQQPSLDAGQRGEFDAITRDLDATVSGFQSAYGQQAPSIAAQAKQLKTANTIRFIAFIVLLFIGIIVLFNNWLVGLILILVALIGSPIAKKVFAGKAQALARSAYHPVGQALNVIGSPVHGTHEATGLAARADRLFLSTLDQNGLLIEQQKRQMAAMTEQHEEQMAQQQEAMRQQQEAMNRMVDEQQATNDALYGKPGFIGSAIRAHDDAKRKQGK